MPGNEHVWHLYTIRLAGRDPMLDRLRGHGIGAGVHYPLPIHLQGAFSQLGHRRGDFPIAEQAAERLLSLPLHPHLPAWRPGAGGRRARRSSVGAHRCLSRPQRPTPPATSSPSSPPASPG